MKLLVALIPILIAITLSYSLPQQNYGYYGNYEDPGESLKSYHDDDNHSKPGLWTKFKNGTRNLFHRCVKLNSTVVHAPDNDNENYESQFNLTENSETKENCWQYLKKLGRKGKGWISRKIWEENQNHDTESTTQRQFVILNGTKTSITVNEATPTERPSEEYEDITEDLSE